MKVVIDLPPGRYENMTEEEKKLLDEFIKAAEAVPDIYAFQDMMEGLESGDITEAILKGNVKITEAKKIK